VNRLTSWHLICIYIAGDACLNVAARVFQIYNAWFFLKLAPRADRLSMVLLVAWTTSTVLLPVAGVISERTKKSRIFLAMAALSAIASAVMFVASTEFGAGTGSNTTVFVVSIVCGLCLSTANAFVAPMATPLFPKVASGQTEVHRAMRIRSSMFIINLLLGPTLAGAAIGQFGGESALILELVASGVGLALAAVFRHFYNEPPPVGRTVQTGFFNQIVGGVRKVLAIPPERTIAVASLFANLLYVPFLFLLLPAKVVGEGHSMLELALVELSMGIGVLFASTVILRRARAMVSEHTLASVGIATLGVSICCIAFTQPLWLICGLAFGAGAGISTFNVTVNARRAASIPDGYRSVMEATLLFFCTLAVPVGISLSKTALDHVSPSHVIAGGGLIFLLAVVLIMFSASLRSMLNSKDDTTPYYKRISPQLFREVT